MGMDRPVPVPERRPMARWPVGVAVLAVLLGVFALDALADRSPASSSLTGDDQGRRTVSVFYLDIEGKALPPVRWRLVARQVQTEGTGRPGYDAVRALLSTRPDDGQLVNRFSGLSVEPDPITDVREVTHRNGVIGVDLTVDPWDPYPTISCICPPGELLTQQLVRTVQTALGSLDPVLVTVRGEPARGIWLYPLAGPEYATVEKPMAIECGGGKQVAGTVDYFADRGGAPTLRAAISSWMDPRTHAVLVHRVGERGIRAFGTREDGSAHTELGLSRVSDGWRVGTRHSCLTHDARPFG